MENHAKYYLLSLKRTIHSMVKSPDDFVKRPGKDFSRKSKLGLEKLFSFLLTTVGKSISNELLELYSSNPATPTASAFVQQRDKLKPNAFETLFQRFSKTNIPDCTFQGYRLLAVDGSSLRCPPNPAEKDSYFPSVGGKKHFNLLHIHALYDLLSHTYVDAIVEGGRVFNERTAFNSLVDRSYIKDAIVIADRGYEAFNTFAHCIEKKWKFLIRVKDGTSGAVIKGIPLPDSDEFDVSVDQILGRSNTKETKRIANYRPIASNTAFDYLPKSPKDSETPETYSMQFRVLRFQISDDSFEVVITNLPADKFPMDTVKQLYAARWGIETSFRKLKKNLGLELLHAKKVESIYHEIFARLTVYNFTALIAYQTSVREKLGKYAYKPAFSNAALICRHLFLGKVSPPDAEVSIANHLTPIRPNRSMPRGPSSKQSASFSYRLS